jgi:SAM-dependent methyltransferase
MSQKLQTVLDLLLCPDDGQPLRFVRAQLLCSGCGRNFPLHEENLAEILPSRPIQLPSSASVEYRSAYLRLFEQQFQKDSTGLAWGAEEVATAGWMRKRRRQVSAVRPLVTEGAEPGTSVLCDIAAGAGHYTLAYAQYFRFVLHCDLSVRNLSYASRKARERNLENIFFLRIDYFRPPFRQSIDRLLCLDTLIRGEAHDSILLKSIAGCLKPAGRAVIDFHNWWHNPLRRLGVLPENFHRNRSYRRSETKKLLRDAAFRDVTVFPFMQEFDPGSRLEKICSLAVPSTRIVYRVCSSATPSETRSFAVSQGVDTGQNYETT